MPGTPDTVDAETIISTHGNDGNVVSRRGIIIALAAAGALFAGYLSSQWTIGACSGGCSILWGLPTCVYGFATFSTILVAAVLSGSRQGARQVVRYAAVFGVLFSAWYAARELLPPNDPFGYWLVLPNCVYGLIVYAAIAAIAFSERVGAGRRIVERRKSGRRNV